MNGHDFGHELMSESVSEADSDTDTRFFGTSDTDIGSVMTSDTYMTSDTAHLWSGPRIRQGPPRSNAWTLKSRPCDPDRLTNKVLFLINSLLVPFLDNHLTDPGPSIRNYFLSKNIFGSIQSSFQFSH